MMAASRHLAFDLCAPANLPGAIQALSGPFRRQFPDAGGQDPASHLFDERGRAPAAIISHQQEQRHTNG
jgi:hypothetical protein